MLRNNIPISLHGERSEIPQVWGEVKAEVSPVTELGPGSEDKELNFHRRMGTEHSSCMAGGKRVFQVRPGAATGLPLHLQMEIENFESGGPDSKMSHSLGFHMCAGLWRDALAPHHLDFPTGPLQCPHNMAVSDPKESKMEAMSSLSTSEATLSCSHYITDDTNKPYAVYLYCVSTRIWIWRNNNHWGPSWVPATI